jgi:hypothetical protein
MQNLTITSNGNHFFLQGSTVGLPMLLVFAKKKCAGFSSQTKTGLPMSAHPVEEALERFLDVQPWPCRLKQIHKN